MSTDQQIVDNQRRELEAVAERHGWDAVVTFADEGISGARGRDKRPPFAALHAGIARRDFDAVMAWSVDRLRRSLQDLIALLTRLNELHAKQIDLFLLRQGLDTSTPAKPTRPTCAGSSMVGAAATATPTPGRCCSIYSGRPCGRSPRIS